MQQGKTFKRTKYPYQYTVTNVYRETVYQPERNVLFQQTKTY